MAPGSCARQGNLHSIALSYLRRDLHDAVLVQGTMPAASWVSCEQMSGQLCKVHVQTCRWFWRVELPSLKDDSWQGT